MERERERERVVRLDVVVNGFREKEELWMCVFFSSPESANRGMEWLSMGVVGLVHRGGGLKRRDGAARGSPLRQEGGYHRGERVVRKLRKATRSETTRAKQ